MKCIYNNKEIEIEVIGGFKIEELNKEYVLCVYDDNKDSDKVLMVILEVELDEFGNRNLISIAEEEKEIVLNCYNAIKQDILGGE